MTIRSYIEDAIPGVAWAKLVMYAVGGLLALGLLAFAGYWFLIRPGHLADEAARAKGAVIIAQGQAAAQADAQHTVVDHYNHDAVTVTLQQKGSVNVQAAAGSHDPFPTAVGDAARQSLCLYEATRGDPACVELRHTNPG